MNIFNKWKKEKKYFVSYCFWNAAEKRHRFGCVTVKKSEYDFSKIGEIARFGNAVRYYKEPVETEFRLISIFENCK